MYKYLYLSDEDFADIDKLPIEDIKHLVVQAFISIEDKHIILKWGDGLTTLVPFSEFTPSALVVPDFTKAEIIDWGHTLKFGDYEATVECFVTWPRLDGKIIP